MTLTDRLWLQEDPAGKQRLQQPLQAGEGATRPGAWSPKHQATAYTRQVLAWFHLGPGRSRWWEVRDGSEAVNGTLGHRVGSRQRKSAWGIRSAVDLDTEPSGGHSWWWEKPLLPTCSGQNQRSTADTPGLQENPAQGRARRQRSPSVTLHLWILSLACGRTSHILEFPRGFWWSPIFRSASNPSAKNKSWVQGILPILPVKIIQPGGLEGELKKKKLTNNNNKKNPATSQIHNC